MFSRLKKTYYEYPKKFWIVVGVSFIDRVGGTMLFPFFSLYITWKFDVGMTTAGIVLGIFSAFGMIGNMIGGALTDKYGRRKLIISGLVFSAISTLSLGLVTELVMLYPLAIIIGLLSNIAGPAHQAMIADILPEKQRTEGFGLMYVVANMAWIIGPTLGGFIANRSYFALFVTDAIVSSVVALLFYLFISETKAVPRPGEEPEGMLQTFKGYGKVLRNYTFMAFITTAVLMGLVYQQMYNSLSVYLRDNHSIDPQGYGFLMTTSAITVISLQYWITRRIKGRSPFLLMAAGAFFYAIGFTLFGVVTVYWLFAMNVVIITLGEMIIMPVSQTLAVGFAPEEMRGRYMAIFSFAWAIPATVGPLLAGLILDNYNPNLLWYLGGILCLIAVAGFYTLHLRLGNQKRFAAAHVEVAADS
jgi:MFS family permease